MLVALARKGSFILKPRHDILIEVIRTDKHDGLICGVGEGVRLRLYYNLSRKITEDTQKENIDHFEKMLEEQRRQFDEKLDEE